MTGWSYNDAIEIKLKYGVITMPHNIHKALVTAITNTFPMPEGQVKAGFETVIKNQVKQLTQEHYESIANLFTQEPLKGYFRSLSGFGKFIVIEGGDFCGKTTFAEQLHRVLGYRDMNSTLIRSPGGDIEGEKIRSLLVNTKLDEATRTCIFAGNRVHTSNTVIKPLLRVGRNIISTRWRWSADVYQDVPEVSDFIDEKLGVSIPDLYILLECSNEVMEKCYLKRKNEALEGGNELDLMDTEYTANYNEVKDRYKEIYLNHKGDKINLRYNEGTTPPTDREFIDKYKDLLDLLDYFNHPEVISTYADEETINTQVAE